MTLLNCETRKDVLVLAIAPGQGQSINQSGSLQSCNGHNVVDLRFRDVQLRSLQTDALPEGLGIAAPTIANLASSALVHDIAAA